MTQYFFHVRDGESYEVDQDGTDLPDLDAARVEAEKAAMEMVAEYVLRGSIVGNQQFEVADRSGALLAVIPYRSVIHLK